MIKNKLTSEFLFNLISFVTFLNVVGWYWDGWWHVSLGGDTPFAPPHILVFLYLFVILISATILYLRTRKKTFLWMLIFEMCTFGAGILDIIWHNTFGEEVLISPLIVWSPPHLIAFVSTILGMTVFLNFLINQYQKKALPLSFFRITLIAGAIFGIARVIIFPLEPFGWHYVMGFAGVVVTTFISLFYLLFLCYKLPRTGIVSLVSFIFLILLGFEGSNLAANKMLAPHATIPYWLHVLAIVLGAGWIDFINVKKYSPILLGGIMGVLIYCVYFIFWSFVQSEGFNYSYQYGILLMLLSAIGGILAGALIVVAKKMFSF